MIAPAKLVPHRNFTPAWHQQFLDMLPTIRKYAKHALSYLDAESRDDAVEEVVANATVAFARLVQLNKADLAFPTVLARHGVCQFRTGRRVGNQLRVGEVLSSYAQRRKGFVVERLDCFDEQSGKWREAIVEDPQTPVLDQVAFRIDFPNWLRLLTKHHRRIVEALALGHTTGHVAKRFKVSSSRISQIRRNLRRSWQEFHCDPVAASI